QNFLRWLAETAAALRTALCWAGLCTDLPIGLPPSAPPIGLPRPGLLPLVLGISVPIAAAPRGFRVRSCIMAPGAFRWPTLDFCFSKLPMSFVMPVSFQDIAILL